MTDSRKHPTMNDFDEIINGSKPTLVDFYATWCGPCKVQSPIIDQVKEVLGDTANVLKVDVDRNPAISERYRIQSIPTLIVFKNGEALWRGYGVHQADQILAKVREHI